MQLITINKFIEELPCSPKVYFQNRMPSRSQFKSDLITFKASATNFCQGSRASLNLAPFNCIIFEVLEPRQVHLVRLQNTIRLVSEYYDSVHLTNSITTHLLLNWEMDPKIKIDSIVFTWYYYFFMRDNAKDFAGISHNVCFQLEEMIKLILQKEMTIYRGFDTASGINLLRHRLSAERLTGMVPSRGINFRR